MFDRSSNMSIKLSPFTSTSLTHGYDNIADQFKSGDSDNAFGYQTPDASTSLIS